ncbi:type II toxin-antitoxin system VapC family toxin [Sulfuracidifex tepidarius]|nr:type II toxin-antitoxin system VapC family toxin [Sulfuracidifex tepidarius]
MRKVMLDASAIMLYFYGNEKLKEIIENSEVYVNSVNLTEFLYAYARAKGWKEGLFKYSIIRNSFKLIDVNKDDIITTSAKLKIRYNLSLGDSFLLASAKHIKGVAVTSDHELKDVKEVKVLVVSL